MNGLLHDLRYGARALRRTPGMTAIAVLSLALGIGANIVIFSLANALLLRPLPVEQPSRLVRIGRTERGEGFLPVSYQEYRSLAEGSGALAGLAAHQPNNAILGVGEDVREVWMELVTASYFPLLGIHLTLGRGFGPEADHEATGEIVISDRLWKSRFDRAPDVVGTRVNLNGKSVTVIGVAPPGFTGAFVGFDIELWVPLGMLAQALPGEPALTDPNYRFLMLIGRLAPGASRAGAEAELSTRAEAWPRTTSGEQPVAAAGISVTEAAGVHPFIAGIVKGFVALLMGIVGLVLLIACANVANLLLVRAVGRRREIAIRLALGAGRARLVRQLLTESVILALAGGIGAGLLGLWLIRALQAFQPPVGIPVQLDTSIDLRVLAFTVILALSTTLIFGLVPALKSTRVDQSVVLKGPVSDPQRGRLRGALVVIQVAASTLLLVGAALLIRTLINSRTLDPGFDTRRMLVLSPEPGRLGYDEPRVRRLWDELSQRIGVLPGVESVTSALLIPLGSRADRMEVGRPGDLRPTDYNFVSAGYFAAMRMPILRGREFESADRAGAPEVAVVTEALAGRMWPDQEPLGRRLAVRDRAGQTREVEVIGEVQDAKYRTLAEAPRPVVYLASTQWYRADMRLQIRTAAEPGTMLAAVRNAVRQIDPDLPVTITTLEQETGFALVPARIAGTVLAAAGAIGLLLATIGIFGVISFSLAQRTRDFGIRMALGARPAQVGGLVVRQGLMLTGIGLGFGLLLAAVASRLIEGLLYRVGTTDPISFGLIGGIFLLTTLAACWGPVRRATRLDPAVVLRDDG